MKTTYIFISLVQNTDLTKELATLKKLMTIQTIFQPNLMKS